MSRGSRSINTTCEHSFPLRESKVMNARSGRSTSPTNLRCKVSTSSPHLALSLVASKQELGLKSRRLAMGLLGDPGVTAGKCILPSGGKEAATVVVLELESVFGA